jgi:hypothetical protein
MKLNTQLKKHSMELELDLGLLQAEALQFEESDWWSQAAEASGDKAIILISAGGTINKDFAISAPMGPTIHLQQCPHLQQVLKNINKPISRCRLVKLKNNTRTPAQKEINYHWFRRKVIYIPVISNPEISFQYHDSGQTLNLSPGKAWPIDNSKTHYMVNDSDIDSIHLLVEFRSEDGAGSIKENELHFEEYKFELLTPAEVNNLTERIISESDKLDPAGDVESKIKQNIAKFRNNWAKVFDSFGHDHAGELAFRDLLIDFNEQLWPVLKKLSNDTINNYFEIIDSMLLSANRPSQLQLIKRLLAKRKNKAKIEPKYSNVEEISNNVQMPKFESPVFIISVPRAGSSLLFETMAKFSEIWTIGEESHELIEGINGLHPRLCKYSSNRLTEKNVTSEISEILKKRFALKLMDNKGNLFFNNNFNKSAKLRFLEKTPKNALRIPFIKAVFPDALFVFLYRDPCENISSLLEGWRSRKFMAYNDIPDWPYREWSFLLTPGWESLKESSLAEICAHQWKVTNQTALSDLSSLPATDWFALSYADLLNNPQKMIRKIGEFACLNWNKGMDDYLSTTLPVSRLTLSSPAKNKWKKNEHAIKPFLSSVAPVFKQLENLSRCRPLP